MATTFPLPSLRTLVLCLALPATFAFAQPGGLPAPVEAAQKAFEDGQFDRTLGLVADFERRSGRSPRTESLRARALAASGKTRDAYLSTLAYVALAGPSAASDDPGHVAMLALREQLRQKLVAERRQLQETRDRDRLAQADEVVATVEQRQAAREREVRLAHAGQLVQARERSGDANAFDSDLLTALGARAAQGVEQQLQGYAKERSAVLVQSVNALMKRGQRDAAAAPLRLDEVARGQAPYRLTAFEWRGTTIAYRIASAEGGRVLTESGTVQGFDLRRLDPSQGFEVDTHPDGSTLRFRFAKAELWRRGAARYSDGRVHEREVVSTRGTTQLSLWVPADVAPELVRHVRELIALGQRP